MLTPKDRYDDLILQGYFQVFLVTTEQLDPKYTVHQWFTLSFYNVKCRKLFQATSHTPDWYHH